MTATTEKGREILLVGPYGVLGTGVIDAVWLTRHGVSPLELVGPRLHIGLRPHFPTSMSTMRLIP